MFDPLNTGLLEQSETISEVQIGRDGDRLCRKAAPRYSLLPVDGQVALSSTAPDGSTAVVEVLQPGQDFVLASVMSSLPYPQSAHVVQRARLLHPGRAAPRHGGARTGIGTGAAALPVGRFP